MASKRLILKQANPPIRSSKKENISLLSRFQGSFFGLANGDTAGMPAEFADKKGFIRVKDLRGGNYFNLPAGYWTDDTARGICYADSLIRMGKLDLKDAAKTLYLWFEEGKFSLTGDSYHAGSTTGSAMANVGSHFEKFPEFDFGPSTERFSSNGCIMGLIPLVLAYYESRRIIHHVTKGTRITHGYFEDLEAAQLFTTYLSGALDGLSKEHILDPKKNPHVAEFAKKKKNLHPSISSILEEGPRVSLPKEEWTWDKAKRPGFTLRVALSDFRETDSFKEGLLKVVNRRGDADTNGAVFGQIAGAHYGIEGIPLNWINNGVEWADKILGMATQLYILNQKLVKR